jgi:hypothetical protein
MFCSKIRNSQVTFGLMIFAVSALSLAGCSKSNPLIGKWKLQPNADVACAGLDGVQFSETTMIFPAPANQTAVITYTTSGDNWTVNGAPTGPITFQSESGGIKSVSPVECHLVASN